MRIAQVAPLAEAVPPGLYGGTERVVSWLTEELVRQGHQVTLFASGDSKTSATLVPSVPRGLRLAGIRDHMASTLVMLDQVHRRANEFDIIHFHVDLLQFPLFQNLFQKCVTTLHGRPDLPDFHPIYRAFPKMPLVSISDDQRGPMPPSLNWMATIDHRLPATLYRFNRKRAAAISRSSVALHPKSVRTELSRSPSAPASPLKIAAKVDPADQEYFARVIEPLLHDPLVEFIDEIGDHEKNEFLGNARALLFPIDWRGTVWSRHDRSHGDGFARSSPGAKVRFQRSSTKA